MNTGTLAEPNLYDAEIGIEEEEVSLTKKIEMKLRTISEAHGLRIKGLLIDCLDDTMVISGKAKTFTAKQGVTEVMMRSFAGVTFRNEISVSTATEAIDPVEA